MRTDPMIRLQRKSKKSCLSENVRALNVTRLRFRDTHASFAAICFLHGYLLLPRLFASSAAFYFSRGYLLLSWLFTSSAAICFFCDVSLYLLDKNVSRDPFPKSTEFNADHYAILVAHSASFWKFPEPFLCLVGMSRYYTMDEDTYLSFFMTTERVHMDLLAFIQVANPTKVKVGERERAEGEAKLLDSAVGRVVSLLPVALACAGSELEASVDRVIANENVVAEKHKRPRKKRQVVTDARGFSHPLKKLRRDHGTSSGAATGGKSLYVLKELLASSMLNIEVGVAAVATLPLVTSSLSATPEHESGVPTDSITELNLRTIVMTEAVVTSHDVNDPPVLETGTNVTSPVYASMFYDFDFMKTKKADTMSPSYFAKQDLSMGSRELNSETLHQIREMDYHHLFTEFNVGTARQACLNAKVKMRIEYCLIENLKAHLLLKETKAVEAARLRAQVFAAEATEKMHTAEIDALKQRNVALKNENDSFDGEVAELQSSVSAMDLELKDLNVVMYSLRSQKDGLVDQVHALETTCSGLRDQVSGYERLKKQIEEFQDAQINIINDKVEKLDADLLEMALHLEEKFYSHLLTTIFGQRWLLTHGLKLAVDKCLNSQEYLLALGAVISRAIDKGMQNGFSSGINHEKASRSLADVVTYNPAAEADYNSALQRLREVNFPLLAELKSHKDASTTNVMDLLRLEGPLADAPRMSDLQPDVEQLKLPIHHLEDQLVLGETSLSFSLSVTHSRVERIREDIAAQRSGLIDIWVPLVDPLSAKSLIGEASTSDSVPAAVVTITSLSNTFASASSVPPITIEDYEIVGIDGLEDAQGNDQGNVASFPTVKFKKEELDTNLERDPPS
nr:transposase (putative), gypsy type [Tanacetum cinerariifolium]